MATSAQQQQALAAQQYQAQVANQQAMLVEFITLWAALDAAALDATTDAWVSASMRLIKEFRQRSARLAVEFYEQLRRLALPNTLIPMPTVLFPGDPEPRPIDPDAHGDLGDALADALRADAASRRAARRARLPLTIRIDFSPRDPAAEASLRITGPINIKQRVKGADLAAQPQTVRQAERAALVEASGVASRHVLDGGRSTALQIAEKDEVVAGWIRVLGPNPCYFCAMLASRGPVYREHSFDKSNNDPRWASSNFGTAKVHDHCHCSIQQVFSRRSALPEQHRDLQRLWNDHIQGRYVGEDAILAWRRLYERPEVFKRKVRERRRAA